MIPDLCTATYPTPAASGSYSRYPAYPPRHPYHTSSSAIAERPRGALWPSVGSLNKIILPAESSIIVSYASDLRLRNVVFGVTLMLLVIRFVVDSHHQQTEIPGCVSRADRWTDILRQHSLRYAYMAMPTHRCSPIGHILYLGNILAAYEILTSYLSSFWR